MSNAFRKSHLGIEKIRIPFPERLVQKKIKEVRIIPQFNGKFFSIEYVYEQENEPAEVDSTRAIAIDLGLDNLATCVDSKTGASFILDGRKLKSINQHWNKERARLQSIADKQQLHGTTERIARMTLKRNNQVMDAIRKSARYIINYCIENRVGKIVIGNNLDFKRGITLGKVNNQNFTQIPLGKLRGNLANLCERYGIQYVEQEESYTSKASFFDFDMIPAFNPDNPQKYEFSGKRIKRGLYCSAKGLKVNADVNAAANILRKSKQEFNFEQLSSGLLASPLRIRLS
jgi:IS605 OrfB family transposase